MTTWVVTWAADRPTPCSRILVGKQSHGIRAAAGAVSVKTLRPPGPVRKLSELILATPDDDAHQNELPLARAVRPPMA